MINQFQHTSLSQTMAGIRRGYSTRSSQSKFAPHSPYCPDTEGTPVTPPVCPSKTHHKDDMENDIPIGMMGVQYPDLPGLKSAFERIYTGESDDDISIYQACNHVSTYGYNFDEAEYIHPNGNSWGLDEVEGVDDKSRTERTAIAWANYVKTVADANTAVGCGNLKCLISKPFMRMHLDLMEHTPHWSLQELQSFVECTIDEIDALHTSDPYLYPNPRSLVAGWYLDDDGLGKQTHNVDIWEDVVNKVHTAQKACGVKWPFYWADNIDGPLFWRPALAGGEEHRIPQKLTEWVTRFPDDATPVFMPYYYPWESNNWNYGSDPPWKKWRIFMNNLDSAFPEDSYPNLQFQPILEATEKVSQALNPPGHADMHKQIRVVWNLMQNFNRVKGIWFMGWNINTAVPGATSRGIAERNWTRNHKWAEAIQNEPYATEAIDAAIPGGNAIYPNFPDPFFSMEAEAADGENCKEGTRIPYHLAERASFKIEIRTPLARSGDTDPSPSDTLMDHNTLGFLDRVITEGYTDTSPQGRFENTNLNGLAEAPSLNKLGGTSAFWDGTNYRGHHVDTGIYHAYLVVGSDRVNEGNPIVMCKEAPPANCLGNNAVNNNNDDGGTTCPVGLTLAGPNEVTRGDTVTYKATITPGGLTLDTTPTFNWKYTADIRGHAVRITKSIDATPQNPQTTTWSGTMVKSGTLEVRTTVNETEYVQTMDVTVNNRAWATEVPICTDTTGWGVEAPRSHSDLGDVEYDVPFTLADDLETAKVSSGPNKGILYIVSLNLTAPFTVRINRHFGMADTSLPSTWVAFKAANTRYGEIEAKVKARLGFDGTTSGTLYGSWEDEIHFSDLKENLEDYMEIPGGELSDYEDQIARYLSILSGNRIASMNGKKSGWSPSGITINYNY